MKRFLLALAALFAVLAAVALADPLGEPMPDFTVTTVDGGTFSLTEALKDHDAALINFWASWCGPCEMEFPYLQKAYEAYRDSVAVVAVSVEQSDTDDVLADYAAEHGMTFPVANGAALPFVGQFVTTGIPTSVMVDRFGNVGYIGIGAVKQEGLFERLFDAFIGDDYGETRTFTSIPEVPLDVEPASPEALSEALGAEIDFMNDENPYVYPMLPVEIDGRSAVQSTNADRDDTVARLIARVALEEDGALRFDVRTNSSAFFAPLCVLADGARVKSFSGVKDWRTFALPLEAGEHIVTFEYHSALRADDVQNRIWLDSFELLTGEDARSAIAANPSYPIADTVTLRATNETMRRIAFENDFGLLRQALGDVSYAIVPESAVECLLTVDAGVDVDDAFLYRTYDRELLSIADLAYENSFRASIPMPEDSFAGVYFYRSLDDAERIGLFCFPSAASVDAFVEELAASGYEGITWTYIGEGEEEESKDAGTADYAVRFEDAQGNAVSGGIVGFCTDETCVVVTTDEDGVARYTAERYPYHVQILRAPEGYVYNGGDLYLDEGGESVSVVVEPSGEIG